MGTVRLTPWYQFTPGSVLPPKKVFVLQGTKGYSVDDVVCVDEGGGNRGVSVAEDFQVTSSQREKDMRECEGEGLDIMRQWKGKSVLDKSPDIQREYEVDRENEQRERGRVRGVVGNKRVFTGS